MRYRCRKECWFGRLYRPGEEADFAPGARIPAALFDPLQPAPEAQPSRMAALRRQARELGIAPRRAWTARDLAAAIAAAAPEATEASHGQ